MVKHKDFGKSGTEVETFESMEKVKFPRGYDSDFPMIVILDDIKKGYDWSRIKSNVWTTQTQ